LYRERTPSGSSYTNWTGNTNNRLQGASRSQYEGNGRFQTWDDIWNNPYVIGRGVLPGDYIYLDWNEDGQISSLDSHFLRYSGTPLLNFAVNLNLNWKNFDLSMNFQGAGMTSIIYGEQLREPLWGNDNSSAMTQFMDRWHPLDPTADPWNRDTKWVRGHFAYTGSLPDSGSTFNREDGSYLRLKTMELGYNIPYKGVQNLKILFNTYNLFTITKVKYVDPEHTDDSWGYLYPLNKSYTIGLNVTF
jgi:hypothetical protein